MRAFGIFSAFVGILIISTFFGSWYTVGQGERGVVTRFGAVVGTAEPGLGFKAPFITDVDSLSVQTHVIRLDSEEAYSQDQQAATLVLSVNYSVVPSEVAEVYTQFGNVTNLEERYIKPRVRQQVKNVFGRYSAATAISQRDKLNTEAREAVQLAVKGLVSVEGVQLEDVSFSKAYTDAIEARMTAEVEVQKSQQQARNAAEIAKKTVTEAQATADSNLAKAKAEAEGIRIRGEAEAGAIRARGEALKENAGLVALTQAEKWNGQLPTTMVPGSSVPMLGLK